MSLHYLCLWTKDCTSLQHCWDKLFPLYCTSSSLFSDTQHSLPVEGCLSRQVGCLAKKKQKHLNRETVKLKCRSGIVAALADACKRVSATRGVSSLLTSHFHGISRSTAVIRLILHPLAPPNPQHHTFNTSIIHTLLLQISLAMPLDLSLVSWHLHHPSRPGLTALLSPSRLARWRLFKIFTKPLSRVSPRSRTCRGWATTSGKCAASLRPPSTASRTSPMKLPRHTSTSRWVTDSFCPFVSYLATMCLVNLNTSAYHPSF